MEAHLAPSEARSLAPAAALRAFEAFGIEIEYMLVRRGTLDIESAAPRVLRLQAGVPQTAPAPQEARAGELAWSNELVSHVLELKNPSPRVLEGLGRRFHAEVCAMNRRLGPLGLRLMPGGMHPWMDPREAELWSFGNAAVYEAYDRIFGCSAHGWANLQSVHLNLPFAGDEEFARLHAALRLLVPVLPAICAASPFVGGEGAPHLDHRLQMYRHNADSVPSITGLVVPENYSSRAQYEAELLQPMYRAIAPLDPGGTLQHEWLNARGAIARFDRSAIEVRVMDTQECPQADVALAALACDAARWLYEGRTAALAEQQAMPTERLAEMLQACIRDAERAQVADAGYLGLLGMARAGCKASELWQHIAERIDAAGAAHRSLWGPTLELVLRRGCLARRLLRAAGPAPQRDTLRAVYAALCDCLEQGRAFDP